MAFDGPSGAFSEPTKSFVLVYWCPSSNRFQAPNFFPIFSQIFHPLLYLSKFNKLHRYLALHRPRPKTP
jgi:hypothetical protein